MYMILTIYSSNYDLYENVVNGGMSGKVFIDPETAADVGREYASIEDALEYIAKNDVNISYIDYYYLEERVQYHRRIPFIGE